MFDPLTRSPTYSIDFLWKFFDFSEFHIVGVFFEFMFEFF